MIVRFAEENELDKRKWKQIYLIVQEMKEVNLQLFYKLYNIGE